MNTTSIAHTSAKKKKAMSLGGKRMKAVQTFVSKKPDPDEQAAALLERWEAISEYVRTHMPEVQRITWSCQERKWVYILFAEVH